MSEVWHDGDDSEMSYATLDDLRSQLGGTSPADDPAYRAKQLHPLPEPKTIERAKFIVQHCTDKRVLEFGASGPLTTQLKDVAREYMGVDRESGERIEAFDLDDVSKQTLPSRAMWTPDVIVCGEILEHLSNPGWFLKRLRRQYAGIPLIVTVPNAYSAGSLSWLKQGIENVNRDHVAWYSPKTISTLLQRAGYTVGALFYYNGNGPTAEGLIVCTE